jgi:hypothetical protein
MPSLVPRNRRWVQWSLRSLLLLMLLLGAGLGLWGAKMRREARLTEAIRLITASSSWFPGDGYDPIDLVRAVNALYGLGKTDAIEALRRFAKQYPSNHRPDDRHEALRLIIPLLFERADPEDRYPSESRENDHAAYQLDQKTWPFPSSHICVEDDIPFQRAESIRFSSEMKDFSYAIDWAEKCGRLRASPMTPANSPFDAADRLIDEITKPKDGRVVPYDANTDLHIREQVLRAISHLLPAEVAAKYQSVPGAGPNGWHNLAHDDHWETLKNECGRTRWNVERQAYVATDRP